MPSLLASIAPRAALLLAALALLLQSTPPPAAAAEPIVAAPDIVPFEQWAPAACPRPTGEDPAAVRRLVVHHTHEPVAHTPDEVLPALALTCKAHTDRGFSSIGYHYVVDPWGGVWQGRGGLPGKNGRPPATQAQGAHVAGSNAGAVGVVFLGDHADEPPTAAALTAATQLLAWLIQDTGIDPGAVVPTNSSGVGTARFTGEFHPRAVTGHSASNHTECPGKHLRALLGQIRNRMREHLAGAPVSGWEGLPVQAPAVAEPEPEPQANKPAPAEKPAASGGETAGANGGGDRAATNRDHGRTAANDGGEQPADPAEALPAPLAPLVSPVERVAGSLRTAGLLSLAERLVGDDSG